MLMTSMRSVVFFTGRNLERGMSTMRLGTERNLNHKLPKIYPKSTKLAKNPQNCSKMSIQLAILQ